MQKNLTVIFLLKWRIGWSADGEEWLGAREIRFTSQTWGMMADTQGRYYLWQLCIWTIVPMFKMLHQIFLNWFIYLKRSNWFLKLLSNFYILKNGFEIINNFYFCSYLEIHITINFSFSQVKYLRNLNALNVSLIIQKLP